jgi:hypothetical protein
LPSRFDLLNPQNPEYVAASLSVSLQLNITMTLDPHSFTLAQNVQDCNATVNEAKVFFRTDDAINISNEAFSDLVSEFLLSKINSKL